MYLFLSAALLVAYLGNVLYGSWHGGQELLGNTGEMLLLLGVSVAFVAAILRAERQSNERGSEVTEARQDVESR